MRSYQSCFYLPLWSHSHFQYSYLLYMFCSLNIRSSSCSFLLCIIFHSMNHCRNWLFTFLWITFHVRCLFVPDKAVKERLGLRLHFKDQTPPRKVNCAVSGAPALSLPCTLYLLPTVITFIICDPRLPFLSQSLVCKSPVAIKLELTSLCLLDVLVLLLVPLQSSPGVLFFFWSL